MCDRTEVQRIFLQFQAHVERLLDAKIKCVQSDWGGEYQKLHNQFFVRLVFLITCLVLTPTNKMAQPSANIVTLLKPGSPS